MGSIFAVPLVKLSEEDLVRAVKNWPGEIVATRMNAKIDYRRHYRRPVLLLMGSEGAGLSPALGEIANVGVHIPMAGRTESLNVAIATALMLYEVNRANSDC